MKQQMKKLAALCLAAVCTVSTLAGTDVNAAEVQKVNTDKTGYEKPEVQEISENENSFSRRYLDTDVSQDKIDKWKSYSSTYYYNKLPDAGKKMWDELENACIQAAESKNTLDKIGGSSYVDGISKDQFIEWLEMFRLSHPQYFFLDNRMAYGSNGTGFRPYIYIYAEFQDGTTRQKAMEQFQSTIDEWVQTIEKNEYDEQKEKCAVDLICNHTIYEEGTYDQSAYSLVCEGKTVCAGYAATFQILMNAVGIETIEVPNSSHAWNMIRLYDTWYETDVTFMDQNDEQQAGYFYGINYLYYNKSRTTFAEKHEINDDYSSYVPDTTCDFATGKRYSYENPYFTVDGNIYCMLNTNAALGDYLVYAIKVTSDTTPKSVTYEEKNWSVKDNALQIQFETAPQTAAVSGATVKLSAKATGGKGEYTYKFLVFDGKSNWYKIKDFDSAASCQWKTGAVGKKILYVDAKDQTGVCKRAAIPYEVKAKENDLQVTLQAQPGSETVSGTPVQLSAKAMGGTGEYTYKFILCSAEGNWFKIRDYAKSSTCTWTPGAAGKKTLYVDVTDSSGAYKRVAIPFTVNAKQEFQVTFTTSQGTTAKSGTPVQLQAEVSGSNDSYTYKFIVFDGKNTWFKIRDYGKENTCTWTPGATGTKILYVDVKDSKGNYKRTPLSFEVTK